jgi:hypothetical protein
MKMTSSALWNASFCSALFDKFKLRKKELISSSLSLSPLSFSSKGPWHVSGMESYFKKECLPSLISFFFCPLDVERMEEDNKKEGMR